MLKIQRLNTDNWKRLRKIRLAALAEAPYAFGSTFQETTVRPRADWTAQIASLPTFVAVLHGLDSGIVRCSPCPDSEDTADLISMWVAPNARGVGVGEALINAVVDWGRSEGYARLLLDVSEGNSFAIALYKRKGFEATGRMSHFPPPRQHIQEYEMAFDLYIVKEEWWLMWCSFPDLNWARLQVFTSGASEVLDMDGARHQFENELDAKYWLCEDEFTLLSSLDSEDEEEFEIDLSRICPPQADTDEELVTMMYVSAQDL